MSVTEAKLDEIAIAQSYWQEYDLIMRWWNCEPPGLVAQDLFIFGDGYAMIEMVF